MIVWGAIVFLNAFTFPKALIPLGRGGILSIMKALTGTETETLAGLEKKLMGHLLECAEVNKVKGHGGLTILKPSATVYSGIWPDDFLFPQIVCRDLLTKDELQDTLIFLTDSITDLECVPDRVELDGLPVMQPGWYDSPHSYRMPMHLPAAWMRLLSYAEEWGVEIPHKDRWARIITKSFEHVPFSCGLAYIDPQRPYVGFGFFDPNRISGFELMSSMILYRGLIRASKTFTGLVDDKTIRHWNDLAAGVEKNITRLYVPELNGFAAGSVGCRQFSVWANGLAYWMPGIDDSIKKGIVQNYEDNADVLFRYGFTRQIIEETGWKSLYKDIPVGHYTNGGYWSTGTGFVLPALMDGKRPLAFRLLNDLADNLEHFDFTEWTDRDGNNSGAMKFLMGMAIPLLALKGIREGRSFLEYF